MPRRQKPLLWDDGPGARFALQLRALRDQGGATVPTIQQLADEQRLPKSTIYAVLRGRLPTRDTLAVLVTAWAGKEAVGDWFKRLSAAESELETERRQAVSVETPVASASPFGTMPSRPALSIRGSEAIDNLAVQQFARVLRELREAAGSPSLRTLNDQLAKHDAQKRRAEGYRDPYGRGIPVSTLSYMFRGQRFQTWLDVQPLVEVLGGDVEEMRRRWLNTARTTSLPLKTIAAVEQER